MATLIRAGVGLLLLGATACEPTPLTVQFDRSQVVVHGMLVAGSTTADVLIVSATAAGGSWGYSRSVPLSGATVRLVAGGDTIPMTTVGRTCAWFHDIPVQERARGCYSAEVPDGIRSGVRHDLIIDLPGGGRVTGSTVVPAVPVIETPAEGGLVRVRRDPGGAPLHSVPVTWSGVAAEARSELRIAVPGCVLIFTTPLQPQEYGMLWLDVSGRSEVTIVPRSIGCEEAVRFERGTGTLVVAAYDANYTRYADDDFESSLLAPAAQSGVTGAYGVFGSAAVAYRGVEIEVVSP